MLAGVARFKGSSFGQPLLKAHAVKALSRRRLVRDWSGAENRRTRIQAWLQALPQARGGDRRNRRTAAPLARISHSTVKP